MCKCVLPEPNPHIEWFCARCALEQRAVVCPNCKNGTVARCSLHPLLVAQGLGSHRCTVARCTKCSLFTIAPSGSGDKRKYNEVLADLPWVINRSTVTVFDKRLRSSTHGVAGGNDADGNDDWW